LKFLVIGFGNPGRGDDGLGPAIAERLEVLQIANLTVESDYQLTVEHAAMAAEHDLVVFADAAVDSESAFYFRPCGPAPSDKFSSHSVTPSEVLLLAQSCFQKSPEAYVLGIRATKLDEFGEGLSEQAQQDLELALEFILRFVTTEAQRHREN
jgi:hydrogenase maturation protease